MASPDRLQNSSNGAANDKESVQHVDEVVVMEDEKIAVAPEVLTRLLRKLDLRLLPLLCALYLMAYLDRYVSGAVIKSK